MEYNLNMKIDYQNTCLKGVINYYLQAGEDSVKCSNSQAVGKETVCSKHTTVGNKQQK